jgi:hypothetical protein
VGDVLVSSAGNSDMPVLGIEPGGRFQPGTRVFRGAAGTVTLGLTDPASRAPATTVIRTR